MAARLLPGGRGGVEVIESRNGALLLARGYTRGEEPRVQPPSSRTGQWAQSLAEPHVLSSCGDERRRAAANSGGTSRPWPARETGSW